MPETAGCWGLGKRPDWLEPITLRLSAYDLAGDHSQTSEVITILPSAPEKEPSGSRRFTLTFALPNPFDRNADTGNGSHFGL